MSEGQPVKVKSRPLQCKHCGEGDFVHRNAQLNTAFFEWLDLGWLNKSADVYVCTHCGFLHWFLDPQVEQRGPVEELKAAESEPQFRQMQLVEERVPVEELEERVPVEESSRPDDLAEPTECLACHYAIPAGSAKCPSCGWSYK